MKSLPANVRIPVMLLVPQPVAIFKFVTVTFNLFYTKCKILEGKTLMNQSVIQQITKVLHHQCFSLYQREIETTKDERTHYGAVDIS